MKFLCQYSSWINIKKRNSLLFLNLLTNTTDCIIFHIVFEKYGVIVLSRATRVRYLAEHDVFEKNNRLGLLCTATSFWIVTLLAESNRLGLLWWAALLWNTWIGTSHIRHCYQTKMCLLRTVTFPFVECWDKNYML